ncbi:uncharacterized protein LOC113999703 isoform X1 [Pipra filicauda]|uniref:Uncharacterized protein LOC113999703 isoform X1 n=1 Tax=Pipra filicauda TaxID=649802 RepID=A0A7R5KDF2_9PASS|nr:uncharacterized protein LOC113999703 isoform X1 [Pipra filicauda]
MDGGMEGWMLWGRRDELGQDGWMLQGGMDAPGWDGCSRVGGMFQGRMDTQSWRDGPGQDGSSREGMDGEMDGEMGGCSGEGWKLQAGLDALEWDGYLWLEDAPGRRDGCSKVGWRSLDRKDALGWNGYPWDRKDALGWDGYSRTGRMLRWNGYPWTGRMLWDGMGWIFQDRKDAQGWDALGWAGMDIPGQEGCSGMGCSGMGWDGYSRTGRMPRDGMLWAGMDIPGQEGCSGGSSSPHRSQLSPSCAAPHLELPTPGSQGWIPDPRSVPVQDRAPVPPRVGTPLSLPCPCPCPRGRGVSSPRYQSSLIATLELFLARGEPWVGGGGVRGPQPGPAAPRGVSQSPPLPSLPPPAGKEQRELCT